MPEPATRARRTPAAPMGAAPTQSSRVSIREIKKCRTKPTGAHAAASLSDVTCPTSILIGRIYVADDLRLLAPSPSCGRLMRLAPMLIRGNARQFQNYDEFR